MNGTLTHGAVTEPATVDAITNALTGTDNFWLDLTVADPPAQAELRQLLTETFHFHPIAVDGSAQFGQRAHLDDFDDFVSVVSFGMAANGRDEVEVHCFVTNRCIITIHQGDCPALAAVPGQLQTHHVTNAAEYQIVIFYLILNGLVDSFFPVLANIDDAIDDLQAQILVSPTEAQLGTLFDLKRQILSIRKIVAPQRDMIGTLNSGLISIPGLTDQGTAYFRNLYDHLIRISDEVDTYRDLLSGAMDTHLSMVSNRLNVVMKQLAIIATIFMPLGFLTGFFGQNFSWTINHLQSTGLEFLIYGVVPEFVAIGLLMWLFRRRGWLGAGPTA